MKWESLATVVISYGVTISQSGVTGFKNYLDSWTE